MVKMSSNAKIDADIWKSWEKSGKEQFFKQVTQTLKDETKSPLFTKTGKISGLSLYIYELINSGVKSFMKMDHIINSIKELCKMHADMPSIILDIISVVDASSSLADNPDERKNFATLLRQIEPIVSEDMLKERLEIDTLQEVGTLKNKTFYTKFIKIKTKLYYKQRKFNLFREESEGYSKLMVELNQEFKDEIDANSLLEIIKSLIGCFNLDPNRVLDIILESFECRTSLDHIFVPIIRSYMNDPEVISVVLGFKLTNIDAEVNGEPANIMTVIALLLQHKLIKLDDIYCWFTPEDQVMIETCDRELKAAYENIKRLNVVSTKTPTGGADAGEDKDAQQTVYHNNQKLVLGTALLKVGCLSVFQELAARLPEGIAVSSRKSALALCHIIHILIDPLYRDKCKIAPKIKGKPVSPLKGTKSAPQCKTFEDLKADVLPAIITLGGALHHDPILMYKLIRILRAARQADDCLQHETLTILDASLLPALAHLNSNCCMAEELFTLIKLYPYQTRYALYGRWKNDTWEKQPSLVKARATALLKMKAIMKRVSKENIKPQGRLIGKLSHAAPIFLFDYMLLQIQIYDNLIGPVVESLKYLTSFSYDVLGYCLLEALASGGVKDSSGNTGLQMGAAWVGAAPPWLASLAAFAGSAYKKYTFDLTPALQYVANQLKAQRSQDLIVLKEIVTKMAGIESAEDMTNDQLDAMAGGDLLKSEAGYFSQARNTRRSSARLKEAVSDNNIDIALCLLSAQQKYCCVWKDNGEGAAMGVGHLKLVGRLVDQCQDALVQLGSFLASAHTPEHYAARLPSIQDLIQEYHVGAEVAFFLYRPVISRSDNQEKLVKDIIPLLPAKVWEDISPDFYVTFWTLTMYDLKVPEDSYSKEIEKLKAQAVAAAVVKDSSNSKAKKEQERFQTLIEKLQEERRRQIDHVNRTRTRLEAASAAWLPGRPGRSAKNETVSRLMQLCLFPRCTFTPNDARYTAEFLHTLHALKTPNFSTLLCYDRLFCDIAYSVMSCTEAEAGRYGEFLCCVLGTAMRWHAQKSIFQKECEHYPGFVTKYRVSNQFNEANDHVGYENYRHVCHKWHYKITKAMVVCLDSGEYVQIRNAIIVLIRILPFFPVLAKLSQIMEKKIEKVREEEKGRRQDLSVLATSYCGQLRARANDMMCEADFHQVADKPKDNQNEVQSMLTISTNNGVSDEPKKEKVSEHRNRREESAVVQEKKIEIVSSVRDSDRSRDEWRRERSSPRERPREERYLDSVSPPLPEYIDRDTKRRKIEMAPSKGKESEERLMDKEKRKTSKVKSEEVRKERKDKVQRKRERIEEPILVEQKRRRDDQKSTKSGSIQNGSQDDYQYEKSLKREKSPFRDRSYEHESRDKHRRSNEGKLRR